MKLMKRKANQSGQFAVPGNRLGTAVQPTKAKPSAGEADQTQTIQKPPKTVKRRKVPFKPV